ncbi:MAG TPA: hydroxylamine reductase [Epulopiscium sp.]|nr:hydroxylamine reductase [Candidatus Epulonipiscium sp.]
MIQDMFCYQCEQTAGGKGCTKVGVCGKTPEVAALQDLLIHILKGIGFYGEALYEKGEKPSKDIIRFMAYGSFSTLTNVNFDPERFVTYIKQAGRYKDELEALVGDIDFIPSAASYKAPQYKEQMLEDAKKVGIMYDQTLDADIRSLRETLIYGMKGMGAYAHHADVFGKHDDEVDRYFFRGFSKTIDDSMSIQDWVDEVLYLGNVNIKCMELLDKANCTHGNPEPTHVRITMKKGPFIVVSGHDMKDMKELLEQTKDKGINIYTHSEMLPAHGYPELNKYKHLVGNFGGAWQKQQDEFKGIEGAILMTTNCLMRPGESYKDRIFTTSMVGFDSLKHIEEKDGKKDFSEIIEKALSLKGFPEDEAEKTILVGFGHNAVLSHAGKIVEGVKSGAISHFFLIGGCDGARPGRNYYTDFALQTPKDSIILTLACGKYRFNKIDFGSIGDLPRLLDVGQCNDAYSAVKIATALAEAFECGVNDLPLSIILSWYEQKAVVVLLSLLSLGIKNIRLGPTLPAFLSPNVLQVLVEKFNIKAIGTPEDDLKAIIG